MGGHLYLTDKRLVFEPHAFNVQRDVLEIALETVGLLSPCWTRFLGLVPVFPNSMAVTTLDGRVLRFVVSGRREWMRAIDVARGSA